MHEHFNATFTITDVADFDQLTVFECRLTFHATVLHDTDDILKQIFPAKPYRLSVYRGRPFCYD